MSAWPERRRAAPLQMLLDRASAFVLKPPGSASAPREGRPPPEPDDRRAGRRLAAVPDAPATPEPARPVAAPEPLRPVVAVLGLAPRAGASTLARALAGRLAGLDPSRAAVLFTAHPPRGGAATSAASRLARLLAGAGCDGGRAIGRVCLLPSCEPLAPVAARRDAPVVADVSHGAASEAAVVLADHVVLVCPPDVEPALASAVETSLRAAGSSVSLVVSRAMGDPAPELERALAVPESRLAAQLTLACREPRGALAAVAAELAERSLAEVVR